MLARAPKCGRVREAASVLGPGLPPGDREEQQQQQQQQSAICNCKYEWGLRRTISLV